MMNYDAMLEARYQATLEEEDAFVNWCEENDLDPATASWDDYQEAMADLADDYFSDLAESMAEDFAHDW